MKATNFQLFTAQLQLFEYNNGNNFNYFSDNTRYQKIIKTNTDFSFSSL